MDVEKGEAEGREMRNKIINVRNHRLCHIFQRKSGGQVEKFSPLFLEVFRKWLLREFLLRDFLA